MVDETGDVKKGNRTAGVQRQYTGTAGRIENCQVAVYLTYAAPAGHALTDRELYLPKSWTGEPARCRAAGIPEGTVFATKPKLARQMIARTLDAGAPVAWAAGDEVYGADPGLRTDLETREIGYVLAVAKSHPVNAGTGACRADQLAARLPTTAWHRYSAGEGAKGHRCYDWAWASVEASPARAPLAADPPATTGPGNWRSTAATPPGTSPSPPWSKWRARRTVEEDFQASKGLAGLHEHQVRRWDSWHRWSPWPCSPQRSSPIAAAAERATHPPPDGQIPLTRNEIARLLATLIIQPLQDAWHRLRWSAWRRRHQHRARTCHYQRQAREP